MSDPLMSVANEMRSSLANQELMKEKNENAIVNGVLLVFDMTDASAKMLTRMSPEVSKKTSKIFQVALIRPI